MGPFSVHYIVTFESGKVKLERFISPAAAPAGHLLQFLSCRGLTAPWLGTVAISWLSLASGDLAPLCLVNWIQ